MSKIYMNRVFLIGRLRRGPVLHESETTRILFLQLETHESWKKGDRQMERTDFHDVVVFKDLDIDFCIRNLKLGDTVLVEGKLHYRPGNMATNKAWRIPEIKVLKNYGRIALLKSGNELDSFKNTQKLLPFLSKKPSNENNGEGKS